MNIPSFIQPMLLSKAVSPFNHPDYIHEIKYDGWRCLATIHDGQVKLVSRNGNSLDYKFQHVIPKLAGNQDMVIDGEIVAIDELGRSRFAELWKRNFKYPVLYYVFDILELNGKSLFYEKLLTRKQILKNNLVFNNCIRYTDHLSGENGSMMFASLEGLAEGIISKKIESVYRPGKRSNHWIKVKHENYRDLF